MGEVLQEGGDRNVTYKGGLKKCMLVKEGMGIKEVQRMVTQSTGRDFLEHKVCYSLKHDRQMLMLVEANKDVRMISNGNKEHGYLYGQ